MVSARFSQKVFCRHRSFGRSVSLPCCTNCSRGNQCSFRTDTRRWRQTGRILPFILPEKGKFPVLSTGETVYLRGVGHALRPANLFLKFPPFSGHSDGLNQVRLAGRIQIEAVVQTLIPGAHHHFLITGLVETLQME